MTQERDMPREDAEGDRGASLRDRATHERSRSTASPPSVSVPCAYTLAQVSTIRDRMSITQEQLDRLIATARPETQDRIDARKLAQLKLGRLWEAGILNLGRAFDYTLASRIEARSGETAQPVRPEGREPGGEAETPTPSIPSVEE